MALEDGAEIAMAKPPIPPRPKAGLLMRPDRRIIDLQLNSAHPTFVDRDLQSGICPRELDNRKNEQGREPGKHQQKSVDDTADRIHSRTTEK